MQCFNYFRPEYTEEDANEESIEDEQMDEQIDGGLGNKTHLLALAWKSSVCYTKLFAPILSSSGYNKIMISVVIYC